MVNGEESTAEKPPPAVPIVQIACVAAIVALFWLDTKSQVSPPRELYWGLFGLASGLIPKQVLDRIFK